MSLATLGARLKAAFIVDNHRRLVASLLAFFVLLWLGLTLGQSGITDDDDFYAPAGIAYADQLGRMLSFQPGAWNQASIDRAFKQNSEHPPLAKYMMGLTHRVLFRWTGLMTELDAARFGVVLLAALLAYLLASFVHAWRGPLAAGLAVLALFAMPRFFFHSQVATLDVAVASLYFLTAYAFWRSRHSLSWGLASGVIFGLALLTKLNAPFAVIPIVGFVLIARWREFQIIPGRALRLPHIPLSLISMLILGPLVFVALWPHLWFDSFKRIGAYIAFHLNHYPIYLYYMGKIYNKPFAPWTTPFVQLWITTPLVLLAAMAAGLINLRGIAAFVRRGRPDLRPVAYLTDDEKTANTLSEEGATALYVLLHLFVTIGVVAFLGAPKYGGVKLFLPFFPFAGALAGVGMAAAIEALLAWLTTRWPRLAAKQQALGALLAMMMILPALLANLQARPFGLSYFGAGVGGLRGATALGFERQYYDVADKGLAAWLSANAPQNAALFFAPNNKEFLKTYRWLRRDRYVRPDLRVVSRRAQATLLVLYHERRWATYPALAQDLVDKQPLYQKKIDGVPLYSVYQLR